ncbi:MAG: hypothetical protein WA688_04715 [Thermoplasmata archaeon]
MRSVPLPRVSLGVPLSRALPRVGTLLVLLGFVALFAVTPVRAGYGDDGAYAWSNGPVLCVFNDSLPAVTVSATSLNGTGMGAGLDQINEVSPMGVPVASAVMSSVEWDPENTSSAAAFGMNYSESVPVVSAGPPVQHDGAVLVTLLFGLDRTPTSAPQADQVSFQLSIQGWPWQSPQDTLALVVPIWSAFATTEHVVVGSPSSPRVESVRTANGQSMEYFEAGAFANATAGAPISVAANTTITAGIATTTLTLGAGAGGASALSYQATLGITPSTRVLGLPLYDYAAVAGGAGLVALVVGFGTRRVRRRPSDLTYVEEAE